MTQESSLAFSRAEPWIFRITVRADGVTATYFFGLRTTVRLPAGSMCTKLPWKRRPPDRIDSP